MMYKSNEESLSGKYYAYCQNEFNKIKSKISFVRFRFEGHCCSNSVRKVSVKAWLQWVQRKESKTLLEKVNIDISLVVAVKENRETD